MVNIPQIHLESTLLEDIKKAFHLSYYDLIILFYMAYAPDCLTEHPVSLL